MSEPAAATAPLQDSPQTIALKVLTVLLVSGIAAWLAALKAGLGPIPAWIIGAALAGVGSYAVVKLQGVPREIWFCFVLKILSVTAYKALNVALILWLAIDQGMGQTQGLAWVGAFGIVMSASTVLAGSVTDALGLRKTLLAGVTICVLSRLAMIVAPAPWLAIAFGLLPVAIGEALCTPVLVAAVRKFTLPSQRSIAFSLFYAIMNLGFLVAYFVSDALQQKMAGRGPVTLLDIPFSPEKAMIAISLCLELLLLPVIFMLRNRAEMTEHGLVVLEEEVTTGQGGFRGFWQSVCKAAEETRRLLGMLLGQKGFYRLLIFLGLIGLLKIVFNIMDYVLPTFVLHEIGIEAKKCIGRINMVNGILILILAPAMAIVTQRFSAYSMVVAGGLVTAASFVFLVVSPDHFQAPAAGLPGQWVGSYLNLTGSIHPYYLMLILWQVMFSIGEAIYSPRVYEYAAAIAPKGQEASYSSLSYIPLLLGKVVTTAAFGTLLDRYCPAEGPRDSSTMWLIVACLVLIAPVGLLCLSKFIRVKEEGR